MQTVEDVMSKFGNPASFGRAIGISSIHAATMKRRKSIPVKHWPKVIQAASELDIELTLEDLVRIHAPAPIEQKNGSAA